LTIKFKDVTTKYRYLVVTSLIKFWLTSNVIGITVQTSGELYYKSGRI